MANPFDKYFGKEDILNSQVCTYLKLQYPNLLWWHTPNESKKSKFEQYKAKKLGIKSGIPDIIIVGKSINIAIELKVYPNKLTPNQADVLDRLGNAGWITAVCYSLDEVIEVLKINLK